MSLLSKPRGVSSPSASAGVGGSQKDNLRLSRGLVHLPVQGCRPARRIGGAVPFGRMVLPCWAAGSWGLRFPAARIKLLRWSGAVLSFGVHRFDLIPTIVVIASLL